MVRLWRWFPDDSHAALCRLDAAYFLGRRELLDFFNELLALQLQKIEQTASGAIACQLTEYIFPNSVPMAKYVHECGATIEPSLSPG
jgi:hypothetical protein